MASERPYESYFMSFKLDNQKIIEEFFQSTLNKHTHLIVKTLKPHKYD